MEAPVGSFSEGDVADFEVAAVGEDEHFGAEVFGEPPLVDLVVTQHELAGAALKGSCAGDAEALGFGGYDKRACCCGHGVGVG